jgi:hypothetical protein
LISLGGVLGASVCVPGLKKRQVRVGAATREMESPPVETSCMERLTRLLEKAEPILQAGLAVGLSEASPVPSYPGTVDRARAVTQGP